MGLVRQLAMIEERGLTPSDYDAAALTTAAATPLPTALAQADFDVTLTTAAIRALRALQFGRVSAGAAHAQLHFTHEPYDVVAALRAMAQSSAPSLQFDQAEPPYLHYRLLKSALARYRALARDTTLQQVALHPSLRPGAADAGIPPLRRLLVALGDLPASALPLSAVDSLRYDSALVAGVQHFQGRHGLTEDGLPGPATLARLRRPFTAAIAQIALSLERWRWLPHILSDPAPIIVNVPAFRLHTFTTDSDREADLLSMNVIVGKAYQHRTPVFSAALRYIVFSPYWDVPPSIARKELLPIAYRDANYLDRNDYEIVNSAGTVLGTSLSAVAAVGAGRARLRQKPGVTNALGGVKFIFPNEFNVYLHDTPTQSVFQRARRDASHGCIRIAQPARLAQFLLRDQPGWDSTAVANAMAQPRPKQVTLTRPVQVHIVYATAVAREDGDVLFFDDIYGHDRSLARLLAMGYPYPAARR
jgi:murein L,D-transpeptidase YcbB/YkuD